MATRLTIGRRRLSAWGTRNAPVPHKTASERRSVQPAGRLGPRARGEEGARGRMTAEGGDEGGRDEPGREEGEERRTVRRGIVAPGGHQRVREGPRAAQPGRDPAGGVAVAEPLAERQPGNVSAQPRDRRAIAGVKGSGLVAVADAVHG